MSDQAENIVALRAALDKARARIEELEPLAVQQTVRDAGFSLESAEGKTLARLSKVGATVESVLDLAADIGFIGRDDDDA